MKERFPRVFVTRRLKKDGNLYYGPYFPGNLAHRIVDLIHRNFLVPSCKLDLTRYYPRPCLQYYIKRCLGPCVLELTTPEIYRDAITDVKLFLEGRQSDLSSSLRARMEQAASSQEYERAGKYRDLVSTVEQLHEKQRMDTADGEEADVFGYHCETDMLAVNLFHMRGGRVLDRREMFWEDLNLTPCGAAGLSAGDVPSPGDETPGPVAAGFVPAEFFSTLLKQIYIDQQYVPRFIYVPWDFEDRETLAELLSEKRGKRVEILVPLRGEKRSLLDLAARNARQSFEQRFRVVKPATQVIQEALQDALTLPELPRRIECFDISHLQGSETVASMVVWEDGKIKKSDYRKFIIRSVAGVDDFASMREVVTRRYARILQEEKPMPSLVLIDGGIGQLHAAAQALEALSIVNQPLASIAKKEEIIYVHGQEDEPVYLDRHSPVLHLVQLIRDESHRFAVTFHRKRRQMRDRKSELLDIPGIGERSRQRLIEHFGSLKAVREADAAALSAVVTPGQAAAILQHLNSSSSE